MLFRTLVAVVCKNVEADDIGSTPNLTISYNLSFDRNAAEKKLLSITGKEKLDGKKVGKRKECTGNYNR